MIDLSKVTRQDFEPCVNQVFTTQVNGQPIELKLVECKANKPIFTDDRAKDFREPFTLRFQSESDLQLPQGNFELHCQTIGELALFLVPVREGEYAAVFN